MDETPNQQPTNVQQDPPKVSSALMSAINSWYRSIPPKIIATIMGVVAVVGIISLLLTFRDFQTTNHANQLVTSPTKQPAAQPVVWETYKSQAYPFEFMYPSKLKVKVDNYNGQETITLQEVTEDKVITSDEYPTTILIKLYGKGFVTFTEDKTLTNSYKEMYQKDFKESMTTVNGIKTRIFSGYIDGNNDGELDIYEATAYLWNGNGEVFVRINSGEQATVTKDEMQQLLNSIKIISVFPPVNPIYLEPTVDPNAVEESTEASE